MFKNTKNEQLDMFSDVFHLLPAHAIRKLEASSAWQNVFYRHYTSQIDEQPYSILYSSSKGRPNSSIRVMLAMMLIKEYNGWSDEQLFDQCIFNVRVRLALGLRKLDTDLPSTSTYYEFRAKVARHILYSGQDLIAQTFSQVCINQISELDVNGSKIRMDSKLIQSNIAKQNRLQLVVEAVRVFIKKVVIEQLEEHFTKDQYELLEKLNQCSTSNLCYSLNKEERTRMFRTFGEIIQTLISLDLVGQQNILYKIFNEQFECRQNDDQGKDDLGNGKQATQVIEKDSKDIGADSIQSVHDPEAAYRKKGKSGSEKTVNGYHTNITETCDEPDKPNLITSVITTPANISECDYLQQAIQQTDEKLVGKKILETITDGGYDSIENRMMMKSEDNPNWILQKQKGPKRLFLIRYDDNKELEVRDKQTGKKLEVTWSDKAEKYRIIKSNGKPRYMSEQQIADYIIALQFNEKVDSRSYNLRASVESTIHEVFHRLWRRSKIRYRGLIKCHWYVMMRAMAVNIGRIGRHKEANQAFLAFFVTRCISMLHVHFWKITYHKFNLTR